MTLFEKLAGNFENLIAKGTLKLGDKMPSIRAGHV